VVDFFCSELKLVLELEGEIHSTQQHLAADRERAAILKGLGRERGQG
jgi:very-short-patch-repair endonuclease